MATVESMMMRCNAALIRIEDALLEMEGSKPFKDNDPRPIRRIYRDREMLRVMQLEAIADWIEDIASKPKPISVNIAVAKTRKPRTLKRKAG